MKFRQLRIKKLTETASLGALEENFAYKLPGIERLAHL
jgi:hypothetical protein